MKSQEVVLCGDGKCDSAKYCTYTLLDTRRSKVVDFKASVTQVSNSNAMELHGFKEALETIEERAGFHHLHWLSSPNC